MDNKEWLIISEAIDYTGKAESTIRRVIKEVENQGNSEKYLIKEPYKSSYKYYIKKDYLADRFGLDSQKKSNDHDNELVNELRDRVQFLEKHIESMKMEHQKDKQDWKEMASEAIQARKDLLAFLKASDIKNLK